MRAAKDALKVAYSAVLCIMLRPSGLVEAGPLAKPSVYCHAPCQMCMRPGESQGLLWEGRQDAWEDTGEGEFRDYAHKSIGNQTSLNLMEQFFFLSLPTVKLQENKIKIHPILSFCYFPCS